MAGFLASLTRKYHEQLDRHRNHSFLDAAMASCALVAMAEGSVSFRHRVRIDQVMETLDSLRIFDPHDGVELFNRYIESIRQSSRKGRESAIETIKKEAASHPDKAALLIRICLAVSEKEGKVPLTEQIEVVGLCGILGLDTGEFGLYTDSGPQV